MVLFLTLPPDSIDYPYILINANNPENGIRYIVAHRKVVEMVIIDSGIEIFRDPRRRDYPGDSESWIKRLVSIYDTIRRIVPHATIYVTAPDYPDDYHHKALWFSENYTNIERTIENVLKCVDWYSDVNWLIPVQGWNRRPSTLLWSLEYLDQLGVLQKYRYLAVANLCVELNTRIIRHGVMYVATWLKEHGYHDHRIHVFGLKIAALQHVQEYIYSFDSTAWTRPVSKRLHDVFPWSAKTEEERVLFFCEYLLHLTHYNVAIPIRSLEICLETIERTKKTLLRRYPSKQRIIEEAIEAIVNDLEAKTGNRKSI